MNSMDHSTDIEYCLDKICRICLCVYDDFSSLFSTSEQQGFPIKINEQIMSCTGIEVRRKKKVVLRLPLKNN